jgi:hypothetical protein
MRCFSIAILACCISVLDANAQSNKPKFPTDPKGRRALREQCVARFPASREAVETSYGDEFAWAALHVTNAEKLIECSELGRLPRISDVLMTIARVGDDATAYVVTHTQELHDRDAVDAWLDNPLEFSLGLSRIQDAASARRSQRLTEKPKEPEKDVWGPDSTYGFRQEKMDEKQLGIGIACLAAAVIGIAWWRKRKAAMMP